MESLEERMRQAWERAEQANDRANLTFGSPELTIADIEARVADMATERFIRSQTLSAGALVLVQGRPTFRLERD